MLLTVTHSRIARGCGSVADIMYGCRKSLDRISDVKGMAFAWCDAAVTAVPAPNGLAFNVLGDCMTTLDDMIYRLKTVRLLMPSAHRLWRSPSPLEVQFVHEAPHGDRLVLAALFREGEPNADVHAAIASLVLGQSMVRLIDLIPLGRRFFVHDTSDPARGRRELHMVSETEMAIVFEQLAALYADVASHRQSVQL